MCDPEPSWSGSKSVRRHEVEKGAPGVSLDGGRVGVVRDGFAVAEFIWPGPSRRLGSVPGKRDRDGAGARLRRAAYLRAGNQTRVVCRRSSAAAEPLHARTGTRGDAPGIPAPRLVWTRGG